MKINSKIIAIACMGAFMASCAEQEIDNYIVEKPASLERPEWLQSFGNIKDYVNRQAYPNFKIACALGADDYNQRGVVYRVANYNFDEITLGNAMKYGSVVGDDGTMTFTTINELLDNAEKAGMSVYGHTLAWHAQQNVTWLNKQLADVEVEIKPEDRIQDFEADYSGYKAGDTYPYAENTTAKVTFGEANGSGYVSAAFSSKKHVFYLTDDIETVEGGKYEISLLCRSSKTVSMSIYFGDKSNTIKASVGTDWTMVKVQLPALSDKGAVYCDYGNTKASLDVVTVSVGHYPPSSRPLTDEEKVENLTNEANRWVYAMMENCAGRVKAWDLVNEAISGGDSDGDGYYDLQHGTPGNTTDFFWQDVLGDENYVPVFEKAARAAFAEYGGNPADLKLFVNDYNLESDWDNNAKLKSMIWWIGKWEAKGAKIDGVSSQMHISYYEDENTMRSKAKHMVNMLHLMANTGKLVRISELDMGYVDINGKDVATADLTDEQHQNMANYYRFIIQMFLKIVPVDQQYSICQWCLTDAPAKSGWRANTPVGLWTEQWDRKLTYVGYCNALEAPAATTEDFFEYLKANNLTHFVKK